MAEKRPREKGEAEHSFVVELPPRRDRESVSEKSWKIDLPDGLDFEGQRFALPDGLSVKAEARWLEDSLLAVRLSLETRVTGECARCLGEASLAISDDLMYLYFPRGLELGKNTQLASDDGYMPVEADLRGRTLEIGDQVWETLLTLLPLRLLCKEDCAGLCQNCGADLNEGPCSCAGGNDPRLDALRGVLGDLPE
ncbi:MAG: DUF177 domain-containing protein [Synergistaceae bacterium]|jgi:uncharacterized protein|nr:DUF177 domain-containing protein [Synergistaceae bacterium]